MAALTVTTPDGPGELTVVAVEHDAPVAWADASPVLAGLGGGSKGGWLTGTAVVVRSRVDGTDDVFAVYGRRRVAWTQITPELGSADGWRGHIAGLVGLPSPEVSAWLDSEAGS